MSDTRSILVVGATGKQGGAVINALHEHPLPFATNILALTRNPDSASAKALLSRHPSVTLIKGDLSNPGAIFNQFSSPPWAAFLVTDAHGGAKAADGTPLEQHLGTHFITAAAAHGVSHVIFSSVDRGGDLRSSTDPTTIPHFITKHEIEQALISTTKSAKHEMTYTIIRPVAFMDNLTPAMFGRLFASMWAGTVDPKPLQLVATRDIGAMARNALAGIGDKDSSPQSVFRNASIGIAGEELTQKEANEVFWRVLGRQMPRSWWITGQLLQKAIKEVGTMFTWFRGEGYGVDIKAVKEKYGVEPTSLEVYLRDISTFKR
jgi:uncharacterized protein YbjT (DUF2867 family)